MRCIIVLTIVLEWAFAWFICARYNFIESSNSTFSGLMLLLSLLVSPPCHFSYNITPPQFQSSHLSGSPHFHVLINTSTSVFLSTSPNHISLACLIFSLMFATPALALISSFLIFSVIFVPSSISTFSFLFFLPILPLTASPVKKTYNI